MPSPSSSAQQAVLALGIRLREIRITAGFSGRRLGALTGWHSSKISKIEYGKQVPTPSDIRMWCEHCGVPGQSDELVASLHAAEGMWIDWRRMERTGLRQAQESVVPLWERTRTFRIYSPRMIPAPVQTEDYIRTVLTSVRARRDVPDDVEDAVRVRVDRQRLTHEGNHRFSIVLEENVLRHPVGGTPVMAAQLGHLLIASTLPSISLGVVPLAADRSYVRPAEGFWLFDDSQVSVELVAGFLTITQPREIAMYAQAFSDLAALAVFGRGARGLITAAVTALDS
jgi:transcriptional regulator with XRE-family HTH domain